MPAGGVNGGVGGIQPGTHNAGVQDQQPKKAKWGIHNLFSFSPKKLLVGKQPASNRPPAQSYKTLQQFNNIRTTQPTVHIQVNGRGASVTDVQSAQNTKVNKAFLKQQVAILIEKGYTPKEAENTVKSLTKVPGKNQHTIAEGIAKIPFRNKLRQQWAQWAEQSFLKKGYTPQEARKWSHRLLKEAGTNFKGVEHVVKNTPLTPAMQAAVNAQQQALRQQMKANDHHWGVNHFVQLGFSPQVAHQTITKAQHHFGDDRKGFIEWVQKAPPPRAQAAPQTNPQTKADFVEQKLKPWAMQTLQAKGFSKEDAASLIENLLNAPNGKLEDIMGTIQALPPRNTKESDSTSSTEGPRSQSEVNASKERDRKNLSILGLGEGATRAQAKKTYYKLAMKLHPDKNDAPDADAKFKEMESAYKALEKSTTFDVATLKKEVSEKKDREALETLELNSSASNQDLLDAMDRITRNHQTPDSPEVAVSKEQHAKAFEAFNYLTKESTTFKPGE